MGVPRGPAPKFGTGAGYQLNIGRDLNRLSELVAASQNSITAKAGGTKAAATLLNAVKCRISVCATNGDSVKLPPGYPGLEITIYNAGAANAQVFGSGNDTINAVATGTGVTQNAGVSAIYTCYDVVAGVGLWGRVLSA
jgi:hypothetical protein